MLADQRFAELCPNTTVSEWCLAPSNTTCCGICPNGGISGIEGHISLAIGSFASIIAIALSPESAPSSLFAAILQCDAYAISLLIYLLGTDSSGLDFFHAGYALMLALACLIPITAVATSPPWAVTGEESPAAKRKRQTAEITRVLSSMERAAKEEQASSSDSNSSDSGSDSSSKSSKKKSEASALIKVKKKIRKHPAILLEGKTRVEVCGVTLSHLTLYVGFSLSVLLWGCCFYYGIWGGATGDTRVSLAQTNCTANWSGAPFLVYCNLGLLMLAVVLFVATIINPLVSDVASSVNRKSTLSCNSSPSIVFGASLAVWVLWMGLSFSVYINAGNTILLAASEFSWGFGSVFSALMILVPVSSIVQSMWNQ